MLAGPTPHASAEGADAAMREGADFLARSIPYGRIAFVAGAEANVVVALAQWGISAAMVSKVPAHEMGQACINTLRRYGLETGAILRGGDRLGLLYVENGASQRPIGSAREKSTTFPETS